MFTTLTLLPFQSSYSEGTCFFLLIILSFSFYLSWLLSNFFKYSSLNFLLSYSNNNFVVYLFSNSLLLNSSVFGFNFIFYLLSISSYLLLWQSLITKTNDHTSGKSLKLDIKWKVYKRTRQGVSAKLESYIY